MRVVVFLLPFFSSLPLLATLTSACFKALFILRKTFVDSFCPFQLQELSFSQTDVVLLYLCLHSSFALLFPVAQSAPRNLLTRWDVSSIPANGIFLTKN